MDTDEKVGRRVAELRKQKRLRQEDFLRLLEQRGVSWTQAVLSRIESGKRTLKLTEGFAVADALGVEPGDLSPDRGDLYYRIENLRLELQEAQARKAKADSDVERLSEGLSALMLFDELREGRDDFEASGSAGEFVDLLSSWLPRGQDAGAGDSSTERAERALGIESLPVEYDGPVNDDDAFNEALDRHYGELLGRRYPNLRFVARTGGGFSVKGVTVYRPRIYDQLARLSDLTDDISEMGDDGR